MSRSASPLRYPGGKACLYDLAVAFIEVNDLKQRNYVEPYSGGCGLALSLLFGGHVAQIHLNDVDRSVWAFWHSALYRVDELIELIRTTPITVDEWERQRAIQFRKIDADTVELGFSTFFLNRTNRSGIIHSGGIIGGKTQSGNWKMDCRYNIDDLISRIRRVSRYRNRISVFNQDAEQFLKNPDADFPETSIIYIDPPYYEKGSQLYKNSYKSEDHTRIALTVARLKNPWFMTYDNVEPIRNLYSSYTNIELDIGYSVQTKRRGSELLVVSPGMRLPVDELATAH